MHIGGGESHSANIYSNYGDNPRRNWFNNDFINGMPKTFNKLIKTVIKKNLSDHTTTPSGITTKDKVFFISYSEVLGDIYYSDYKGSQELEGNQYEYYKINSNRIKYINNNGTTSSRTNWWWLRSPSTNTVSGYNWMLINTDGSANRNGGASIGGITPAFCL